MISWFSKPWSPVFIHFIYYSQILEKYGNILETYYLCQSWTQKNQTIEKIYVLGSIFPDEFSVFVNNDYIFWVTMNNNDKWLFYNYVWQYFCQLWPSSSMMGIYPIREKSPIDQMGKKYMGKINGIFHHRINLSQWYKLQ